MIKSEQDIIYNRIKNTVGFDKSKQHLAWVGKVYPGRVLHHLFGSYTGKKTTDYTVLPITPQAHEYAEKHKSEFALDNIHKLIILLIERIKFLEKEKNVFLEK